MFFYFIFQSTSNSSKLRKHISERHSQLEYDLPEDISLSSNLSSSSEDDSEAVPVESSPSQKSASSSSDEETPDEPLPQVVQDTPDEPLPQVPQQEPTVMHNPIPPPRPPISKEWICCSFCDYVNYSKNNSDLLI